MIYRKNSNETVADFYRRNNSVMSNFRMCDSFALVIYTLAIVPVCMELNGLILMEITCMIYTLHNCIISRLTYGIEERPDRRLTKFIYNLLHSKYGVVQSIADKVHYYYTPNLC